MEKYSKHFIINYIANFHLSLNILFKIQVCDVLFKKLLYQTLKKWHFSFLFTCYWGYKIPTVVTSFHSILGSLNFTYNLLKEPEGSMLMWNILTEIF